jgi:hypothetical protein
MLLRLLVSWQGSMVFLRGVLSLSRWADVVEKVRESCSLRGVGVFGCGF